MPAAVRPTVLRKILEEQCSVLTGELVTLYEQEMAAREAEMRESVRGELAENLNQAVRLLRQAEDFEQVSAVLADASLSYCRLLAILAIHDGTVRAARVRGLTQDAA